MIRLLLAALAVAAAGPARAQPVQVDPAIRPYASTSGVSGSLNSVGSDTLNNLMTFWGEGFRKQYPSVRIQIEGKGSSTAPPALIAGSARFGPMSRAMKQSELDEFEKKFGYPPTAIRVAVDAVAVYVNKDNPLDKLTLPQVDAIFSRTRRCGGPAEIRSWDSVGLNGSYAGRPLSTYGRNSASGTYGYFKKVALCKGDYRDTVKEQPGSASVVQGVGEDRFGIGYSGIGYQTSAVKALALARKDGEPYATTDPGSVYSGQYPLARYLYLYLNRAPNQPLDALVREFARYVLSREGQQIVVKSGYLPIPGKVAEQERAQLR